MACPAASRGSGAAVSMANVTYQRPSGSREMTTMVGSGVDRSTSAKDHTNLSGVVVLAMYSSPLFMRNAGRV
jgi:hypothetical protein